MVDDEILRLLEEATGYKDAVAEVQEVDGEPALTVRARGKIGSVRFGKDFEEDNSLAVAICKSLVYHLQTAVSMGPLKEIEGILNDRT